MHTNLRPVNLTNTFFRVTAPFPVYVLDSIAESNTYVGRSRAFSNVYRRITAQPGDEVHALVGGVFLVRDGKTFQAQFQLDEKHVFEHGVFQRDDWPLENLDATATPSKPELYNRVVPTVDRDALSRVNAQPVGRSIDFWFEDSPGL